MNIAPPPLTGDFSLDRWLSLLWKASGSHTISVPVSASGTSITFTGIPSDAKRVTVQFSGVSTNGISYPCVQLGDSGGIETSGYLSYGSGPSSATNGFHIFSNTSADLFYGVLVCELHSDASNQWVSYNNIVVNQSGTYVPTTGGGNKSLSDRISQLRVTTVGGTATFDAGTISITVEK